MNNRLIVVSVRTFMKVNILLNKADSRLELW